MAEKKALLVLADALDLNGSGEALDKLKKKAAVLPHADAAGLKELAVALGGVCADASGIEADPAAARRFHGCAPQVLGSGDSAGGGLIADATRSAYDAVCLLA